MNGIHRDRRTFQRSTISLANLHWTESYGIIFFLFQAKNHQLTLNLYSLCHQGIYNFFSSNFINCVTGADQEIFQRGVEEENFERKMFVESINACTH